MDLSTIKLPPWLMPTTRELMQLAEQTFGPGSGPAKKAWVKAALLDAARRVNVAAIPDWVEDPAKAVLVDILIEAVWGLVYAPRKIAQKRAQLLRRSSRGGAEPVAELDAEAWVELAGDRQPFLG